MTDQTIVQSLDKYALKIGCENHSEYRLLLEAFGRFRSKTYLWKAYQYLQKKQQDLRSTGPFAFSPSFDEQGPVIGTVLGTNSPFPISEESLSSNIYIVGRTGGGKSTLLSTILSKIYSGNLSCTAIVFDRKQDYLHFPRSFPEVVCIPWNLIRFNPLFNENGKLSISSLIGWNTEVLCHSLELHMGSKPVVMFLFEETFRKYSKPTMFDFYTELLSFKPIGYPGLQIKDRLISRIKAMLGENSLGTILGHPTGLSIDPFMLSTNVVFDCPCESQQFFNYLSNSILAKLYYFKLQNGLGHQTRVQHLLVWDDAHAVWGSQIDKSIDPYHLLPSILSRVRSTGISVVAATQEPSKTTTSLAGNCRTCFIVGNLLSGIDKDFMKKTIPLNNSQISWLNRLEPGDCIVREIRWPSPFLIKVHMNTFDNHVEYEDLVRDAKRTLGGVIDYNLDRNKKDIIEILEASSSEMDFMMSCYNDPFYSNTERIKNLGFNNNKGYAIKSTLIRKKLIFEYEIRLSRKGRKTKFIYLTEKGFAFIQKRKLRLSGIGSQKHKLYQNIIQKAHAMSGLKAVIEGNLNGEKVDILAETSSGKILAIEIELSKNSGVIRNVKKDLAAGADYVVVLFEDESTGKTLSNELERLLSRKEYSLTRILSIPRYLNTI
ncbi:MAG: ATP-binding protein [Nanoarchaeota archaeon]|nr:ATP-binding protein [Nanoarchaeota archaeon]